MGFLGGSDSKESACNAGDPGSIPGSWRSPGEGLGNPLQYSCLENPMDRGAWQATLHVVTKSQTEWATNIFTFKLTNESDTTEHMHMITESPYFWHLIMSVGDYCRHLTLTTEKAVAPHSSTLAWKIQWMEEPGRLPSMGSLRVRHDWATSLSLFIFRHWRRKWQPTPVFLPGESQGWGSLVGYRL